MRANYIVIPLLTIFTAVVGGLITSGGMEWYKKIHLPAFTPPGSFIGTVWTVIFFLATIAALLIFNAKVPMSKETLQEGIMALFIFNAILNVTWSLLFFGQHFLYAAIWEAGVLGLSVIALIIFSWPISQLAAWLLMPYAAWVAFATYLTYTVWALNK
jgi:tryptophan-rich sensory protein